MEEMLFIPGSLEDLERWWQAYLAALGGVAGYSGDLVESADGAMFDYKRKKMQLDYHLSLHPEAEGPAER